MNGLLAGPHRAYGNEEGLIQCKLGCVATPGNVMLATLLIAAILASTCAKCYGTHDLYSSS